MNKEDYVSLEVAKMMKEKGYPQDYNVGVVCRLQNKVNELYERTRMITEGDMENAWCIFNEVYPTIYEAAKWLRQKGICVIALPFMKDNSKKWYHVKFKDTLADLSLILADCTSNNYDTYEEALNAGILEAIKLI